MDTYGEGDALGIFKDLLKVKILTPLVSSTRYRSTARNTIMKTNERGANERGANERGATVKGTKF